MIAKLVWNETRNDGKYVICFMGSFIVKIIHVLFSNFLLLWVTSFVDEGHFSEDEAKDFYEYIMLVGTIVAALLLPFFGIMADRLSSTIMVPLAFSFRALCGFSFMFLTDPQSTATYCLVSALTCATMIEAISIDVLFYRGMPGGIRGTMMGAFTCFGLAGIASFTLVGGQLFDRLGSTAPIYGLATLDSFMVLLSIIMACLGFFKGN